MYLCYTTNEHIGKKSLLILVRGPFKGNKYKGNSALDQRVLKGYCHLTKWWHTVWICHYIMIGGGPTSGIHHWLWEWRGCMVGVSLHPPWSFFLHSSAPGHLVVQGTAASPFTWSGSCCSSLHSQVAGGPHCAKGKTVKGTYCYTSAASPSFLQFVGVPRG